MEVFGVVLLLLTIGVVSGSKEHLMKGEDEYIDCEERIDECDVEQGDIEGVLKMLTNCRQTCRRFY